MRVSWHGVLACCLLLTPTIVVTLNIYFWGTFLLLTSKYLFGDRRTGPLYALSNRMNDCAERSFFLLVAAMVELILETDVAYTIVTRRTNRASGGSNKGSCVGNVEAETAGEYQVSKGKVDLSKFLTPPSQRGKVKIIILNHHCRLDFVYIMCLLARSCKLASTVRIMLKESLRRLPFVGWNMEAFRYIFLTRAWVQDEAYVRDIIRYELATSAVHTILIFPEGTDLSPSNVEKSQMYARGAGLPVLSHVLNPRTTGLVAVKNIIGVDRIEEVIDITLAYTPHTAGVRPDEASLINGCQARKVHMLVQTFRFDTDRGTTLQSGGGSGAAVTRDAKSDDGIPADDVGFAAWVHARFATKDQLLSRFYARTPVGFDAHDVRSVLGPATALVQYDSETQGVGAVTDGGRHGRAPRSRLDRWRVFVRDVGVLNAVGCMFFWYAPLVALLFYNMHWTTLLIDFIIAVFMWIVGRRRGGLQQVLFLNRVPDEAALITRLWRVLVHHTRRKQD